MQRAGKQLFSAFVGMIAIMLSQNILAHTSEIFFAEANVDNQENRPLANVMIFLDNSGSMRGCETTSGMGWCDRPADRRIQMLYDTMNSIIDDLPSNVRLGISKFNASSGGRILVPVTELTPMSKERIREELSILNEAHDRTNPGSSSSLEPNVSATRTSQAFSEVARYMMGMAPDYGPSSESEAMCIETAPEPQSPDDRVYEWGPPQSVESCDINEESCLPVLGSWPSGWMSGETAPEYCVESPGQFDLCELGSWTSWSSSASARCTVKPGLCEVDRWNRYRSRRFRERSVVGFQQRQPSSYCVSEKPTVTAGSYVSPINKNNQCELNHVILFTDGAPTSGEATNYGFVNCNRNDSYVCQGKIAGYLNSDDNAIGRKVVTHNIGLYMGTNESSMRGVSTAGGGATYNADNADALLDAFRQTLDLIITESRSLAAPGVAVNQMNRLQHLGQLYYAVFQPEDTGVWKGNLKRYGIQGDTIHDVRGNDAVDSSTGFFKEGARSFWSSMDDGPEADKGGALGRLSQRKLFFSDSSGTIRQLTDTRLAEMTEADFGIPAGSTQTKEDLVARLKTQWADPLHSVPLLVNYDAPTADPEEQENYVFVSTNGGMLHAIDASDGQEAFAFMPYETLKNAYYFVNPQPLNPDNSRPLYGLDASWTGWRRGGAGAEQASAVYLYGGMRRGGRHYYGLDVSNITGPEKLWQINGGDPGFELLGQTWSTPTLTQVRVAGQNIPVLIFGGGYDPVGHDKRVNAEGLREAAHARVSEDQMGRAVYIVHAETGELIWSASKANSAGVSGAGHTRVDTMNWAVPASIAVVDINFDGLADHLYFGDLGGQIFRVDLNTNAENKAGLAHRVVRLASFGGSSVADNRRFFHAPSVAYAEDGMNRSLVVAIGSGYSAHPLDESTLERIYVVRDESALQLNDGDPSPATVGHNDLLDVTSIAAPTPDMLTDKKGWYLGLSRDGEKVMASPSIFNGRLLVTSYSPLEEDEEAEPCKVQLGRSYLYTMDLFTSAPAALQNSGDVPATRDQALEATTPVSQPQIIAQEDNKLGIIIGLEILGDVEGGNMDLRKRRWYPLSKTAANEFVNGPEDGPEEAGEN